MRSECVHFVSTKRGLVSQIMGHQREHTACCTPISMLLNVKMVHEGNHGYMADPQRRTEELQRKGQSHLYFSSADLLQFQMEEEKKKWRTLWGLSVQLMEGKLLVLARGTHIGPKKQQTGYLMIGGSRQRTHQHTSAGR